jgi:hypothetical protein
VACAQITLHWASPCADSGGAPLRLLPDPASATSVQTGMADVGEGDSNTRKIVAPVQLAFEPSKHPADRSPAGRTKRTRPRINRPSVASPLGTVDRSWHPRVILRFPGRLAATAILLAVIGSVPRSARADGPARGLQLGVRLGLAHPGGAVGAGSGATTPNLGDFAPTWLPVGIDAGYRLRPFAYVGASLDWGPTVEQGRASCAVCGVGYDLQVRTDLRFYGFPTGTWNPWISFGLGWEVLRVPFGSGASAMYQGPVLGSFQVGLDVHSRAIRVGPYFGMSLGEFITHTLDPAPSGETTAVDGRTVHEWFTLGVRGSYGPW